MLSRTRCQQSEIYKLIKELKYNNTLIQLSITYTIFSPDVITDLTNALSTKTTLDVLHLDYCYFEDDGSLAVLGKLQLQELSLKGARISPNSLRHIVSNPKLTKLNLYGSSIGDSSVPIISELIERNTLKELDITGFNFTEGGTRDLSRVLSTETSIEILGFSSNAANIIKSNTTLKHLTAEIVFEEVADIIAALKQNNTLTSVNLQIYYPGVKLRDFFPIYRHNDTIKILKVNGTNIRRCG